MVNFILNEYDRLKQDNNDDVIFYSKARLVHHLDNSFRAKLRNLYKNYILADKVILDLTSSWDSHLPENINYKKVIGHGLNQYELQSNKSLDSYWVQDLNKKQILPLDSNSIDYCLLVAGWQYLQQPELVSTEILRVVKPKGLFIISFSNRAFWTKASNIWIKSNDIERIDYVKKVLTAQGWSIKAIKQDFTNNSSLFSFLNPVSDPFYSVIAHK